MKRLLKATLLVSLPILFLWLGWSAHEIWTFAEGVKEDAAKPYAIEITNTHPDQDAKKTKIELSPEPVDSLLEVIVHKKFEHLKQIIQNRKIAELSEHIVFPLDPRSAYGFGYNSGNEDVLLTEEKFKLKFDQFFREPFLDSLKNGNSDLRIYNIGNKIRWSCRINTWDPKNNERDYGLECTHSIIGYATDSILMIDGFNLLCGGVM